MKKLRKLRLNDDQKLSQNEQDMVLAGWYGDCTCKFVGDTHIEWERRVESTPDYWQMCKGLIEFGTGVYMTAQSGGTLSYPAAIMIAEGLTEAAQGATITSITYHYREMRLISKDLSYNKHSIVKTW